MSNSNSKSYFRDLPDIDLVVGLVNQVYKLQEDEGLKKVLKVRLLSVYRQGFEKPGTTAWESLKGLHEYVLENGMIEENSVVSKLFVTSVSNMMEDEKRKLDKKAEPKVKQKASGTVFDKGSDKKDKADSKKEPTHKTDSSEVSKLESARRWVGRIIGPRDQQPLNKKGGGVK